MQTFKMTDDEYTESTYGLGSPGFCRACGEYDEYAGCEPDAEHYVCPSCGAPELFGLEQCLILGYVEIVA